MDCEEGFYLLDSICVERCPGGSYGDERGECSQCSLGCLACELQPGAGSACTSCLGDFVLKEGVCKCRVGTILASDESCIILPRTAGARQAAQIQYPSVISTFFTKIDLKVEIEFSEPMLPTNFSLLSYSLIAEEGEEPQLQTITKAKSKTKRLNGIFFIVRLILV